MPRFGILTDEAFTLRRDDFRIESLDYPPNLGNCNCQNPIKRIFPSIDADKTNNALYRIEVVA